MIPTIVPIESQEHTGAYHLKVMLLSVPWKSIFQRIPGLLVLFIFVFSVVGPVYFPIIFTVYFMALHAMLVSQALRTCYAVTIGFLNAKIFSRSNWYQKYLNATGVMDGHDLRHDMPFNSVTHVIIIPNYKEDMNTLCETLDILASHSQALTQYRVCLAMEESEPLSDRKAEQLLDVYKDVFFDIRYTVHPVGRPGEIRGKSSNVAWAALQMARLSTKHDNEIITVMDADTAFAADYFASCTYYYAVASPSERNIMMFCPCTVFDRNAKDVPIFVRVTDMFWSIGNLSNMYPGSPVKIPTSAYSVSMNLAISVNFWDTGPEAVGEDMHMYLKCYFSTQGRVVVKSIYSPVSSCNIEGKGTGIKGYISGLSARYTQAKRHLWGSLDTGYVLRRSLLNIIAPESQKLVKVKNTALNLKNKSEKVESLGINLMLSLWLRMIESHLLLGQLFPLLITSSILVPTGGIANEFQSYLWNSLSNLKPNTWMVWVLGLMTTVRNATIVTSLITWYFYEKYHEFVGFTRWQLYSDHLGKRSSLKSPRTSWFSGLDWLLAGPAGFVFYVIPMFHAQLSHLITDHLDYTVAAKPVLARNSLVEQKDACLNVR